MLWRQGAPYLADCQSSEHDDGFNQQFNQAGCQLIKSDMLIMENDQARGGQHLASAKAKFLGQLLLLLLATDMGLIHLFTNTPDACAASLS